MGAVRVMDRRCPHHSMSGHPESVVPAGRHPRVSVLIRLGNVLHCPPLLGNLGMLVKELLPLPCNVLVVLVNSLISCTTSGSACRLMCESGLPAALGVVIYPGLRLEGTDFYIEETQHIRTAVCDADVSRPRFISYSTLISVR